MVAGSAVLSGSAAAYHLVQGDRVRVTDYSSRTYEACCAGRELECSTATRSHGDEGEVLETCTYGNIYPRVHVLWDTRDSDQYWLSWINEEEIEKV